MVYARSLLTILLLSISLFSNAQHRCGTSIYTEQLSAKYKDYSKARSKARSKHSRQSINVSLTKFVEMLRLQRHKKYEHVVELERCCIMSILL